MSLDSAPKKQVKTLPNAAVVDEAGKPIPLDGWTPRPSQPQSIPVKSLSLRSGFTVNLPGGMGAAPSVTASDQITIEFIPGMRHHLITWKPRHGGQGDTIRRFVPESWCTFEPL